MFVARDKTLARDKTRFGTDTDSDYDGRVIGVRKELHGTLRSKYLNEFSNSHQ
jgi:hypothetical protein